MTRYRDTVLFSRWLNEGGSLTFGEWLAERRTRAEQQRQLHAYAKRMALIWAGMQQASPEMVRTWQMQQAVAMQGVRQMHGPTPFGQGLGGMLGGLFGAW